MGGADIAGRGMKATIIHRADATDDDTVRGMAERAAWEPGQMDVPVH